MTDIFNSPALDKAIDAINDAKLTAINARLKRLTVFINIIREYLELEPDLGNHTDWHSNDDALNDFTDKIRQGESRDFRAN